MTTFDEWVAHGVANGWVSEQYCAVHDGGYDYFSAEDRADYDQGGDPCEPVLRILQ